jgi:hypothetical protein
MIFKENKVVPEDLAASTTALIELRHPSAEGSSTSRKSREPGSETTVEDSAHSAESSEIPECSLSGTAGKLGQYMNYFTILFCSRYKRAIEIVESAVNSFPFVVVVKTSLPARVAGMLPTEYTPPVVVDFVEMRVEEVPEDDPKTPKHVSFRDRREGIFTTDPQVWRSVSFLHERHLTFGT